MDTLQGFAAAGRQVTGLQSHSPLSALHSPLSTLHPQLSSPYLRPMSRILAIDFGSKRCGIAVTDSLQMIGTGLKTIAPEELIPFLKKYTSEEEVECLVVGEPLQKDGTASSIETEIQAFLKKLKTTLPELKINRYDERFTSKMAFQSMIDSGLKKKARQNKALVDEISATIILNDYLEFRKSQARNG